MFYIHLLLHLHVQTINIQRVAAVTNRYKGNGITGSFSIISNEAYTAYFFGLRYGYYIQQLAYKYYIIDIKHSVYILLQPDHQQSFKN